MHAETLMITMTATDVARTFSKVLDRLEHGTEEIAIVRNHHTVAKLVPGAASMTALEAFSDLYGVLSSDAGKGWLRDCRGADRPLAGEVKDPWA